MIPSFDLPVLASLAPAGQPVPQPDPVLRAEGPGRPFPEVLAGLNALLTAPVEGEGENDTGKDLPQEAKPDGNDLPDVPPLQTALLDLALVLPLVQQAPHTDLAATAPQSDAPAPLKPDLPKAAPVLTDARPRVVDLDLAQPASDAPGERAPSLAGDAQPVAVLTEVAAPVAHMVEVARLLAAPREAAPAAPAPASTPAAGIPGAELEQLVEVLAQAREAGRGARGELALRHAEFGTVAIRLEQAEGETRATLAGRDPGFAPAVVAALAERAATGSFEQQHAPQHQRGGEPPFAGGQGGDARQSDRRGAPERIPHANPVPRDNDQPAEGEPRHGRFA